MVLLKEIDICKISCDHPTYTKDIQEILSKVGLDKKAKNGKR